MISILDYGAGNLRSVQNTLQEIGAEYQLIHTPAEVLAATKLVLPGVGHFGQMIRKIDEMQVREPMLDRIRAGVPFLGICLGMQAMFARSEEAPELAGFGLLDGEVKRFRGDEARVPQMGWNLLDATRHSLLLQDLPGVPYVYFANSYYAPVVNATAATTTYTLPFTSVIEQANLYGVQFHPEKSGPVGMKIVRNFVEAAC